VELVHGWRNMGISVVKRVSRHTAGLLLLVSLCGCATKYRAGSGYSSGYWDLRISDNIFAVAFTGKPPERVNTYLLQRCAEIALTNGYDFFKVLSRGSEERVTFMPSGDARVHGGHRREFIAAALIRLEAGPVPRDSHEVYDAHKLIRATEERSAPAPSAKEEPMNRRRGSPSDDGEGALFYSPDGTSPEETMLSGSH
jgi:hypothetical protein